MTWSIRSRASPRSLGPERAPRPAGPEPDLAVDVAQASDQAVERRLRRRRVQVAEQEHRQAARHSRVDEPAERVEIGVPLAHVQPDRDARRAERRDLGVERMGVDDREQTPAAEVEGRFLDGRIEPERRVQDREATEQTQTEDARPGLEDPVGEPRPEVGIGLDRRGRRWRELLQADDVPGHRLEHGGRRRAGARLDLEIPGDDLDPGCVPAGRGRRQRDPVAAETGDRDQEQRDRGPAGGRSPIDQRDRDDDEAKDRQVRGEDLDDAERTAFWDGDREQPLDEGDRADGGERQPRDRAAQGMWGHASVTARAGAA